MAKARFGQRRGADPTADKRLLALAMGLDPDTDNRSLFGDEHVDNNYEEELRSGERVCLLDNASEQDEDLILIAYHNAREY